MVKRILIATIASSLVFILGCSGISYVAEDLVLISSDARPEITPKGAYYIDNISVTPVSVNSIKGKTVPLSTHTPDLIIETITWSPENPLIGDTVIFTVTIKNQGSDTAGSSRVAYYIDDAPQTSDLVNPMDPGATASETFTWTAQAGSHAITAVADSSNEVTESDETNNEKTYAFSTLAPDLIIETITWSPEEPSESDTVSFSVTIKNQGSDRAGSSHVDFYIDGSTRGSQEVQRIDAGAKVTKTFTWVARAGSHVIEAIADPINKVTESDETNNKKTIIFETLAPDLIIEAITWSPENPSKSDNVTFKATIKNQGSGRAGYSHVAFYINDAYLTSVSVNPIDVGATDNKTFNWIAQAGSHDIKAVADSNNRIAEGDETNNEKTVTFSTPAPDLIIEAITWAPENPQKSDDVTFTVTIKNQGTGKADSSRVHFYIDGSSRGYLNVQEIDAGDKVATTIIWIAQAGSHAIKAVADSDDKVTESDETNNEKAVTFSALAPDLIIETITGSPAGPSIGDTVTFTVTVKNQGSSGAGPSRVYFYIDGSSRGYQSVREINPGATMTKTFTWTTQAGYHDIKAVADSNNEVTESDETNNEKMVTFPVPDLIVETITWSPEEPSENDTVTFTVTIKNQGSGRTDPSRVYFYIDGSSRGYQEVQEINPGAAVTKTLTWTAQTGSHDIKAVADLNNEIIESDETNNEKSVNIQTLAPDLIVETITWSPEEPSENDTVTFSVTIKNQGSGRAVPSYVYFYIDDSSSSYRRVQEINTDATETKTFTWIARAGLYTIKADADSNDEVTESDETNNEKSGIFTVFLPSASTPASAPAPGTKPQVPPAEKTIPAPPPEKGIWLGWWFIVVVVISGGIVAIAKLRFR